MHNIVEQLDEVFSELQAMNKFDMGYVLGGCDELECEDANSYL